MVVFPYLITLNPPRVFFPPEGGQLSALCNKTQTAERRAVGVCILLRKGELAATFERNEIIAMNGLVLRLRLWDFFFFQEVPVTLNYRWSNASV